MAGFIHLEALASVHWEPVPVENNQHANQHANHQLSWRASGPHKRDKSGLPTALGSPATESTTSAYSLPTSGNNPPQHPHYLLALVSLTHFPAPLATTCNNPPETYPPFSPDWLGFSEHLATNSPDLLA